MSGPGVLMEAADLGDQQFAEVIGREQGWAHWSLVHRAFSKGKEGMIADLVPRKDFSQ